MSSCRSHLSSNIPTEAYRRGGPYESYLSETNLQHRDWEQGLRGTSMPGTVTHRTSEARPHEYEHAPAYQTAVRPELVHAPNPGPGHPYSNGRPRNSGIPECTERPWRPKTPTAPLSCDTSSGRNERLKNEARHSPRVDEDRRRAQAAGALVELRYDRSGGTLQPSVEPQASAGQQEYAPQYDRSSHRHGERPTYGSTYGHRRDGHGSLRARSGTYGHHGHNSKHGHHGNHGSHPALNDYYR